MTDQLRIPFVDGDTGLDHENFIYEGLKYKLDGVLYRLEHVGDKGIHVLQMIDEDGNAISVDDTKGRRLIASRTMELEYAYSE